MDDGRPFLLICFRGQRRVGLKLGLTFSSRPRFEFLADAHLVESRLLRIRNSKNPRSHTALTAASELVRCKVRVRNYMRYASIVVVVLNPFVSSSHADSLLSDGDDAVLAAPVANFRNELRRLRLPPAQFQAVDTQYDGPQTNISIELEDLRTALVKAGKSSNDVAQIAAGHLAQRNKLAEFDDQLQQARQTAASESDENGNVRQVASAGPLFPKIPPGAELPQEFADYLEGTVAWRNLR